MSTPMKYARTSIGNVLDRNLTIVGLRVETDNEGRDSLILTLADGTEIYSYSAVVNKTLTQVMDNEDYPFECRVAKVKNYYVLTEPEA